VVAQLNPVRCGQPGHTVLCGTDLVRILFPILVHLQLGLDDLWESDHVVVDAHAQVNQPSSHLSPPSFSCAVFHYAPRDFMPAITVDSTHYMITIPPSTYRDWPVMYAASSLAINTTAGPISRG